MEPKKVSQVLEETYSVCTVCTISRLQSAVCEVCVLGWPKEMRVRKSIYKLEIIFSRYVCPTDVPDVSWELWQFFWEKPEVGWLAAIGTWLADNSIVLALCTNLRSGVLIFLLAAGRYAWYNYFTICLLLVQNLDFSLIGQETKGQSVLRVLDRSDRNPPITATSVTL